MQAQALQPWAAVVVVERVRGEVNRGEENARVRKPWLCHTYCCSPMMSGMLLWYSSSSRRSGRFSNSGIAPMWFHDKSSDLSLGVWWRAVVAVHELCYCDAHAKCVTL